jgi:hypothetical protein
MKKSRDWPQHIKEKFMWDLKLLLAEGAVAVLNRALESDPTAIRALCAQRVVCNEALENDPTIQVRYRDGERSTLGVLGLINGVVGATDDGLGLIAAECDEDDNNCILRFKVIGDQNVE